MAGFSALYTINTASSNVEDDPTYTDTTEGGI